MQRLIEISPVVLEEKMNMIKVYRQTDDRQTDRSWTTGDQKAYLSFQLR